MHGTCFSVEIRPHLPAPLERLTDLSNDLYYSWDRSVRRLFRHLDEETWVACRKNPRVFMRRVSQKKLEEAARDPIFLAEFHGTLSTYDTYMQQRPLLAVDTSLDMERDLIAYFSAEFGFHQSVPIYAGGLGILAGDYCKAMSNLWVPFVGVGLLYREGYFTQRILHDGTQLADYPHVDPEDMPVHSARDAQGRELDVTVDIAGRPVKIKVWEAKAGHVTLLLLDSDLPENAPHDRSITSQLYGGDSSARIQQEIILGIGGVRALRAMQLAPSVWHINEGHPGFQILERCREYVQGGMHFDQALELVAANSVFTTHTPVAAGHDIFSAEQMRTYFADYIHSLGISEARFAELGGVQGNSNDFNMTLLGLRGSRHHNAVSRVHCKVASEMESHVWPQIPPAENPIRYVTNGVDVDTFLGQSWSALFDMYMGRGWRAKLNDAEFWKCFVNKIPNHVYQSVRQIHKTAMFDELRRRLKIQLQRSGCSASIIGEMIQHIGTRNRDTLVIGFARRFATYKRATLLFKDLDRLKRLLQDSERPVLFVIAGKAHPNDEPGQAMIKEIAQIAMSPDLRGKILLLEDYNLSLARDIFPGVDVWLNVPEFPLEACGTSGMKAAINGAINLSVLDGWWAEAYDGENGWAIESHVEFERTVRDRQEATELHNILERDIVPLYFSRNNDGEPEGWIEKSKASMRSILPRFNGMRMAVDYLRDFYGPAARQGKLLAANNAASAIELAQWRKKVTEAWPNLYASMESPPNKVVNSGESMPISVKIYLNGLSPDDLEVECVVGAMDEMGEFVPHNSLKLEMVGPSEDGSTLYRTDLCTPFPCYTFEGLRQYKIRLYPFHKLLSHRFECGLMLWL
ncbi:MAG TPA: alpha-glucan family phosphorylase [Gammaproteobacteria bacterium]|nr:alpha-glucan family phosphorylase [Gammaproteobacteria bacterium]